MLEACVDFLSVRFHERALLLKKAACQTPMCPERSFHASAVGCSFGHAWTPCTLQTRICWPSVGRLRRKGVAAVTVSRRSRASHDSGSMFKADMLEYADNIRLYQGCIAEGEKGLPVRSPHAVREYMCMLAATAGKQSVRLLAGRMVIAQSWIEEGRERIMTAPPSAGDSARSVPPCCSAMRRETNRPMPKPSLLRVV